MYDFYYSVNVSHKKIQLIPICLFQDFMDMTGLFLLLLSVCHGDGPDARERRDTSRGT